MVTGFSRYVGVAAGYGLLAALYTLFCLSTSWGDVVAEAQERSEGNMGSSSAASLESLHWNGLAPVQKPGMSAQSPLCSIACGATANSIVPGMPERWLLSCL